MLELLLTINTIICSSAPTWLKKYKKWGDKVNWTKTHKPLMPAKFFISDEDRSVQLRVQSKFAEGAEMRD